MQASPRMLRSLDGTKQRQRRHLGNGRNSSFARLATKPFGDWLVTCGTLGLSLHHWLGPWPRTLCDSDLRVESPRSVCRTAAQPLR
ncbi:hypothetical protein PsYK624_134540 [Phanerochaete sordida]|uniref:Uncharacterized protein n=1 Tax=Phanerochaete sordida TaxID=48140 RepID=A0A9P3LK10_9APHY|nr:hypothetical protein PsYK624_134540 [Phanerochaete sordida]